MPAPPVQVIELLAANNFKANLTVQRITEKQFSDTGGSNICEAVFNEWSWTPNIAVADTCEEAVPTLPKAECFIACE